MEKLKPLKQGDLNWLCSLYALINLRLLSEPALSKDEAWRDFFFMLRAIEKAEDGDLLCTITLGIDPDDIPWLSEKYGGKRLTRCKSAGLAEIARQLKKHSEGILVFLEGSKNFSHYTVFRRNKAGTFSLFDSHGYDVIIEAEDIFVVHDDGEKSKVTATAVFRPEET